MVRMIIRDCCVSEQNLAKVRNTMVRMIICDCSVSGQHDAKVRNTMVRMRIRDCCVSEQNGEIVSLVTARMMFVCFEDVILWRSASLASRAGGEGKRRDRIGRKSRSLPKRRGRDRGLFWMTPNSSGKQDCGPSSNM